MSCSAVSHDVKDMCGDVMSYPAMSWTRYRPALDATLFTTTYRTLKQKDKITPFTFCVLSLSVSRVCQLYVLLSNKTTDALPTPFPDEEVFACALCRRGEPQKSHHVSTCDWNNGQDSSLSCTYSARPARSVSHHLAVSQRPVSRVSTAAVASAA